MKLPLIWMCAVACAAAVLLAPGAAWAQGEFCNQLSNPGFDEGGGSLTGWTAFGNAFISAPDEPVLSPPAAAKVFGNFSGGFNVTGLLQAFPATPDQTYTMTAWSYVSSADPLIGGGPPTSNWAVIKVAFFDAPADGNEIGGLDQIIATGATQQDEWLFNTVTATAPMGTQRVEALILYLQPASDGGSVFVDDVAFGLEGSLDCDDGDPCTVDDACVDGVCVGTPIECAEGEICVDGECVLDIDMCNLLANPGFDANGGSFSGWFTFANAFISAPDEVWRSAPAAGKMFGNFSGGFNVTGMLQAFPAAEGEMYYMTGWSQVRSADPIPPVPIPDGNWAVMKIAFFDAPSGGNEIGGGEVIIADGFSPQDIWMFNSVSALAPAGTQRVEALLLFLQPGFDPGAVFVDDITFGLEEQCENARSLFIKQDACPAPLNAGSHGVIPMVLTGDEDFDVSNIDVASLDLHLCGGMLTALGPMNGPPGPAITIDDANHPYDGDVECADGGCACNEYSDGDGIDDLEVKFNTDEFVDTFGDYLNPGEIVSMELSGQLIDGTSFHARDCIIVVPPNGLEPVNLSVQSDVPGAYVMVDPVDLNIDGDGFANFGRSYHEGTQVTLTAPPMWRGQRFVRWLVDGSAMPAGRTEVTVVVSADTAAKAVYRTQKNFRVTPDHGSVGAPGQQNF